MGRGEVAHVALLFTFRTDEFLDVDGLVVEIHLCHVVHTMMQFGLDEVVGNHRVPEFTFQFDAVVCKYLQVIFYILSDFQNFRVFVEWFKDINNLQHFFTFRRNGHVPGLFFLHGETQTYQFCLDSVGGSGLGV